MKAVLLFDFRLFCAESWNQENGSSWRLNLYPELEGSKNKITSHIFPVLLERKKKKADREVLIDPSILVLTRYFHMVIIFCQELYEVPYFPDVSEETRKDHLTHWTVRAELTRLKHGGQGNWFIIYGCFRVKCMNNLSEKN